MLLADDPVSTWIGPILTSVSGLAATIIAMYSARDRMKYDAERIQMKSDIAHLQFENKDCHDNYKMLKESHDAMHQEFAQLRSEVARRGFKSDPPDKIKAAIMQARAEMNAAEYQKKEPK